jgi:hypothetical protein
MTASNYLNLLIDADITNRYDQERNARYIDAAIAQEGIEAKDVIGVGEVGTGSKPDLYLVDRQGITVISEQGLFSKRVVVSKLAPIASIARLRGTQEGYKGTELTITAYDPSGEVLFRIVWGLSGPEWVEPLVVGQREHLFAVISEAMDKLVDEPGRPSVVGASSKAGALMDWAAAVVKASGVGMTDERVREHANMVAAGIRVFGFMKLGAPYGIDDLGKFYPGGEMPDGEPIATFDGLYARVVEVVGSSSPVDSEIDRQLAGSWGEFVNGCRETYSA